MKETKRAISITERRGTAETATTLILSRSTGGEFIEFREFHLIVNEHGDILEDSRNLSAPSLAAEFIRLLYPDGLPESLDQLLNAYVASC